MCPRQNYLCSLDVWCNALTPCFKLKRFFTLICIIPAAWECRLHWAGLEPNNQDLNYGTAGASLIRQEVRHCWSVEAGDRFGVTRTATALHWSQHWRMETSFAVCGESKWPSLWIHVSLSICLYCKITAVTDVVLKYFLEYSMTFFASYQPASDMLILVASSRILRCH